MLKQTQLGKRTNIYKWRLVCDKEHIFKFMVTINELSIVLFVVCVMLCSNVAKMTLFG